MMEALWGWTQTALALLMMLLVGALIISGIIAERLRYTRSRQGKPDTASAVGSNAASTIGKRAIKTVTDKQK